MSAERLPLADSETLQSRKHGAASWFRSLQEHIIAALEAVEEGRTFVMKDWERQAPEGDKQGVQYNHTVPNDIPNDTGPQLRGGGRIGLLEGSKVFEKAGVNFSEVYGTFSEKFAKEIPGAAESNGDFWASGISLVIHPRSPHVPAVHMNTRMIATSKCWFGGGADLTPIYKERHADDTADFHRALEECCARNPDSGDYPAFKKWCDEYFFLPHRGETRGTGGIFYDYLEGDWDKDFAFTKDVGETFAKIYPEIVTRHKDRAWSEEERDYQLLRRGRYVEFNLMYDRGTRFGLQTGGNTEAILMSMPPLAKW